jgi:prevent-host-death family protein
MDVGVRELKQRLSEYLDRAARGEVIRITDRGRPKALLTGIRQEQSVARGIREGWLRPGEDVEPARIQRVRARRRALELLREDRDGR